MRTLHMKLYVPYAIASFMVWSLFPDESKGQSLSPCMTEDWNLSACQGLAERTDDIGARAKLQLGAAYLFGLQGLTRSLHDAIENFTSAAAEDYAPAQNILGSMYFLGRGVQQDYEQARLYFNQAAASNYAPALNNLGVMYVNDLVPGMGEEEALQVFSQAADLNYPPSLNGLGVMYLNGLGISEDSDYRQAERLFRSAANLGYAPAQNNLGVMHFEGWGTVQSGRIARDLFADAAEQSYVPAYFNLGLLYDLGEGVGKDYEQAASWYQAGASGGDPKAQYNLAIKYARGEGVKQDFEEANFWFNLALEGGISDARQGADATFELLTIEQKERAQSKYELFRQLESDSLAQVESSQPVYLYNEAEALPELGGLFREAMGWPGFASSVMAPVSYTVNMEEFEIEF